MKVNHLQRNAFLCLYLHWMEYYVKRSHYTLEQRMKKILKQKSWTDVVPWAWLWILNVKQSIKVFSSRKKKEISTKCSSSYISMGIYEIYINIIVTYFHLVLQNFHKNRSFSFSFSLFINKKLLFALDFYSFSFFNWFTDVIWPWIVKTWKRDKILKFGNIEIER